MSLNARTTSLVTTTNMFIVVAVIVIAAITKNPLAILGLFFIQDMPVFQDQVGIEQLRQLGIIGEHDDDESEDSEYQGTKMGFTSKTDS